MGCRQWDKSLWAMGRQVEEAQRVLSSWEWCRDGWRNRAKSTLLQIMFLLIIVWFVGAVLERQEDDNKEMRQVGHLGATVAKEKLEAQLIKKRKEIGLWGRNSRSAGNIRLVSACRHREQPVMCVADKGASWVRFGIVWGWGSGLGGRPAGWQGLKVADHVAPRPCWKRRWIWTNHTI